MAEKKSNFTVKVTEIPSVTSAIDGAKVDGAKDGAEVDEEQPLCSAQEVELGSDGLNGEDSNVATKEVVAESACDRSTCMKKSQLKAIAFYLTSLIFASLFLFITFAAIYREFSFHSYHPEPYVIDYSSAAPTPVADSLAALQHYQTQGYGSAAHPIVVILAGDSIVNLAVERQKLVKKLRNRLAQSTDLKFKIINRSQPSCTVESIMQPQRIPRWVQSDSPHFLLILTNSDVSTSKAKWYGTDRWTNKVHRYREELTNLTTYLDQHMGRRWAFGGPSVLLEGTEWMAPKRLQGFGNMSQELHDINTAHFKAQGCHYMDFRRALRDFTPKWWPIYSMYATQDGEHYSDLGAKIMAENFAKFILN